MITSEVKTNVIKVSVKAYYPIYGGGGGGSSTWGSITGTLSAQTDLQAALDLKVSNTQSIINALIFG